MPTRLLQNLTGQPTETATRPLGKLFAIPVLDAETQHSFRKDRQPVLLNALHFALGLGAAAFLAHAVLNVCTGHIAMANLAPKLVIVLILLTLLIYLRRATDPARHLALIARLGVGLSALELYVALLLDGNQARYAETWPCLLPMYFFGYGQMFISLRAATVFGWSTALFMPLSGYWIGVEPVALIPSLLNLSVVNIFGLCTRCQLEAYSRNSFLEKRRAEQNADAKTRYLHQLSHNLRQPMQALNCYASALEAVATRQHQPETRRVVGRLVGAIDELSLAFDRILDMANLECGKQIPQLTAVDVNSLLSALEHQFAPQAVRRGLRLKIVLRRRPPYCVHSDAIILSQIIGNLIDNAIKYTADGWIVVSPVKVGNGLKLHVRDSGIGIDQALQQDIFQEFFRGRRRLADDRADGLGLGLAFVRKAIERLPDHHLRVVSKPHHGSDFQLCLPTLDNMMLHAETLLKPTGLFGHLVWVIDDDRTVLNALSDELTAWGCLVETAASLAELHEILTDSISAPDLLISDFYLEDGETAHDIIAAVQNEYGPVPTLILSAHAIAERDKARWPEGTRLLRKPAGANTLIEAMLTAMTPG